MKRFMITDGANSVVTDHDGSYIVEADSKCNRPTALFDNKGEAAQLMREDFPDYPGFRVVSIESDELPEHPAPGLIPLYHHRTDGGAEYLSDKFILCDNGHKEGIFKGANYIVRLDGPPELTVRATVNAELLEALEDLIHAKNTQMGASAVKLRYDLARAAIARAKGTE